MVNYQGIKAPDRPNRCISNRSFEGKFNLADLVEVQDVDLKNGLLTAPAPAQAQLAEAFITTN